MSLHPRGLNEKRSVVVAVDRDNKGSQHALRWATNHVLSKGQTVTLLHVNQNTTPLETPLENMVAEDHGHHDPDNPCMEVFLPYHVFCSCKEVRCDFITLNDQDIAKALINYVALYRVETLVLGAPSKHGISRLFNKHDTPTTVLKGAPDFCSVYVISKGKIASVRVAAHPIRGSLSGGRSPILPRNNEDSSFRSPLRISTSDNGPHDEIVMSRNDFPFMSTTSLNSDNKFFEFYDNMGYDIIESRSTRGWSDDNRDHKTDQCFSSTESRDLNSSKAMDTTNIDEFPPSEDESDRKPMALGRLEDMDEKMRRLELQMNQTMDMYHAACKEALREKKKSKELQLLVIQGEKRLEEALWAKEQAFFMLEKEKELRIAAIEMANKAQRKAEREGRKRKNAEKKAFLREVSARNVMLDNIGQSQAVLKYQSLLKIIVVIILFYFYFFEMK